MASYTPITEKETVSNLKNEDTVIIIQNGQVRQLNAADIVAAIGIANALKNLNISIGNSDISKIGDGTLTGAIAKLFEMVSGMPTITSGSEEPTGGKDGDIYVMYED